MLFLRYIAERLVYAIPVLLGVSLFVFVAIQFVPGDPIRIMMHGRISDVEVAAIYARLGMDRPLPIQYLDFVRKAAGGDLGLSIIQNTAVSTLVGEKLAPTFWLLGMSTVLSVLIALPLALLAAMRRNRPLDHVIRVASMIGFAMPPFWIGLILMLFFGLRLGLFPISGFGTGPLDHLRHLFLPALTIACFLAPILVQSLRSSMLDVLAAEFVEVARAKGLGEWRILVKHVLRNALIPVVTVIGLQLGLLLSGAVLTETIFSLPGLGRLMINAILARDYPVVQAAALFTAFLFVVVNLFVDLSYAWLDPRIRYR